MNKFLITLILFCIPVCFLADNKTQNYNIEQTATNGHAEFGDYLRLGRKTSNVRCQAITKKGTQCKRFAQKGSKYCWQHQKNKHS